VGLAPELLETPLEKPASGSLRSRLAVVTPTPTASAGAGLQTACDPADGLEPDGLAAALQPSGGQGNVNSGLASHLIVNVSTLLVIL
jgi:hypothetical protein